jgi:hypothetical protein
MPKKVKVKKAPMVVGGYFAIPHQVTGSVAYRSLSSHAAKLLIDFGSYYRGNNNGDLSVSFKILKKERGWKSSGTGTITFTAIGQACILQYITSKWFVVGNNGTTFA